MNCCEAHDVVCVQGKRCPLRVAASASARLPERCFAPGVVEVHHAQRLFAPTWLLCLGLALAFALVCFGAGYFGRLLGWV